MSFGKVKIIQGPPGPAGPQGPMGPVGPPGIAGATGAQGRSYDASTEHARAFPLVNKYLRELSLIMDDGELEYISRNELMEFIQLRRLVEENEIVRAQHLRLQMAVKMVDNG